MKKIILIIICALASNFIHAQMWSSVGSGMLSNNWYEGVEALAVYNGELYAGGTFYSAGGVTVNNIAKWNGTQWDSVGGGVNNSIIALAVYNGELYAGGYFDTASGIPVNYIARWNGTSWSPVAGGASWQVLGLGVYNSELYCAVDQVTKWNGTTWVNVGTTMNDNVYTFCPYNGEFFAGGIFTTAGGNPANAIAKWNGTTWSNLGSGMGGVTFPFVSTLADYNGYLYAGGEFTTAGGSPAINVAKWNGTTWSAISAGITGSGSYVYTSSIYNGELWFGGWFTVAGGNNANNIAKWNGTMWDSAGSGMNDMVKAFATYNGALYAGGWFTTAGGLPSNRIAKLTVGSCSANYTLYPDTSQPHTYWIISNSTGASPLHYVWNWGDNSYDTIPLPSHTYASAGFYNICLSITDSLGCSSTYCNGYNLTRMDASNTIISVNVVTSIPTGIPEKQSDDIFIYPNPSHDLVKIIFRKVTHCNIQFTNTLGEVLEQTQINSSSHTLDMSSRARGIYFVTVTDAQGSRAVKKVVKM